MTNDWKDLYLSLIRLSYIDSNGFVTKKFNLNVINFEDKYVNFAV